MKELTDESLIQTTFALFLLALWLDGDKRPLSVSRHAWDDALKVEAVGLPVPFLRGHADISLLFVKDLAEAEAIKADEKELEG